MWLEDMYVELGRRTKQGFWLRHYWLYGKELPDTAKPNFLELQTGLVLSHCWIQASRGYSVGRGCV